MTKVFAVASVGGHWIQLLRIAKPLEKEFDVAYLSTHEKCGAMVDGHRFYKIPDFSRWDAYKVFPAFFKCISILRKEKPKMIITTGAAPGLVCILAGKCLGIKSVWIDSIANVAHLSFSGKIASKIATRTYTQWEVLKDSQTFYAGNVLG